MEEQVRLLTGIASDFSKNHFTILAGGLNKDNIINAIEMVKPDVVDLSSSVETDGYKDYDKIKEFMERIEQNGIK